jgi:hypothetical protein
MLYVVRIHAYRSFIQQAKSRVAKLKAAGETIAASDLNDRIILADFCQVLHEKRIGKETWPKITEAWQAISKSPEILGSVTFETKVAIATRRCNELEAEGSHKAHMRAAFPAKCYANGSFDPSDARMADLVEELRTNGLYLAKEDMLNPEDSDDCEGESEDVVQVGVKALTPEARLEAMWRHLRVAMVAQLVGNSFYNQIELLGSTADAMDAAVVLQLLIERLEMVTMSPEEFECSELEFVKVVLRMWNGLRGLLDPSPHCFNNTDAVDVKCILGSLAGEDEVFVTYADELFVFPALLRIFKSNKFWKELIKDYKVHVGAADTRGAELKEEFDKVSGIVARLSPGDGSLHDALLVVDPDGASVNEAAEIRQALLGFAVRWSNTFPSHKAALREKALLVLNTEASKAFGLFFQLKQEIGTDMIELLKAAMAFAKIIEDKEFYTIVHALLSGLQETSVQEFFASALVRGVANHEDLLLFMDALFKVKDMPRSSGDIEALTKIRAQAMEIIVSKITPEVQGEDGVTLIVDKYVEFLRALTEDKAFLKVDKKKKQVDAPMAAFLSLVDSLRSICQRSLEARQSLVARDPAACKLSHEALVKEHGAWKRLTVGKTFAWGDSFGNHGNEIIDLGNSIAIGNDSGVVKQLMAQWIRLVKSHERVIASKNCALADCAGGLIVPSAKKAWSDTLPAKATEQNIKDRFAETMGHKLFKGQVIDEGLTALVKASTQY